MQILVLLGMYFDAVVVEVEKSIFWDWLWPYCVIGILLDQYLDSNYLHKVLDLQLIFLPLSYFFFCHEVRVSSIMIGIVLIQFSWTNNVSKHFRKTIFIRLYVFYKAQSLKCASWKLKMTKTNNQSHFLKEEEA